MTNIQQLEREWKSYKQKQLKPYIIGLAAFLVVTIIIISSISTTQKPQISEPLAIKQSPIAVEEKVLPEKPNNIPVQELRPSFDFMKSITTKKTSQNKKKIQHKKVKRVKKITSVNKPLKKRVTKSKQHISVNTSSTKNKIGLLASRFNKNRDPNLGIIVAKQYYKNKQYKKSYFYALEVNTINRKNEESWIITAKSLYFLNNKKAALKLLNDYLRKHNSAEAIKVYRAMKQGRLK